MRCKVLVWKANGTSNVSGKGTRRIFRTPVVSIGLSYEPWVGAGRQKSLGYDVICPANTNLTIKDVQMIVFPTQPKALLSRFMNRAQD